LARRKLRQCRLEELEKVDTEDRDERGSGRSQNVVHTLPRSMASVPQFLTGPLERIDPTLGTTQVLVITADAETAMALTEAVLRMTGPAGIELLPVTTPRRAKRLMAGRPVLAAAGSPGDIRDLVRGSELKLDGVKAVVIAWADEILHSGPEEVEALELVMNELPKDAARIVVTSRSEGRVNAFAERYLRRARREAAEEIEGDAEPVTVQYVTVTNATRTTGLRRLLDDLDPPSAAIIVSTDQSEQEVRSMLRMLGYPEGSSTVRTTRGEIAPSTYAVIFYDAPASHSQLADAAKATPVSFVALVDTRELASLKRIGSVNVRPFTLSAPWNAAREREDSMRRELSAILDAGVASREMQALEPLLERHDGIEIAAAALRLLEKERTLRKASEEAKPLVPPRGFADRKPFGARDAGKPRGRDDARRGGPPRGDSRRSEGGRSEGGRGDFRRGSDDKRGGGGGFRKGPRRDAR
jgi:ATP-dependent RNA helicase DeaD